MVSLISSRLGVRRFAVATGVLSLLLALGPSFSGISRTRNKDVSIKQDETHCGVLYIPGVCSVTLYGNENTVDHLRTARRTGNLELRGIKADRVLVHLNGQGNVALSKLECREVSVSLSGKGSVSISGRAFRGFFDIGGEGDILAGDLRCDSVVSKVTGQGNIKRQQ